MIEFVHQAFFIYKTPVRLIKGMQQVYQNIIVSFYFRQIKIMTELGRGKIKVMIGILNVIGF